MAFFRLLAFDLAEKLGAFGFVDGEDDAAMGAGDVGMGFLLFPLNRHDLEKPRRKKRSAPFCPLRKKRRKSWEIGAARAKRKGRLGEMYPKVWTEISLRLEGIFHEVDV